MRLLHHSGCSAHGLGVAVVVAFYVVLEIMTKPTNIFLGCRTSDNDSENHKRFSVKTSISTCWKVFQSL